MDNDKQVSTGKIRDWVKIRFIPDVQEFESIPLPNKDGQVNTRKVVKAKFINPNPRNPEAPLEVTICHQKKKVDGTFEDCEHFQLNQLKVGQEIRMILDTEQTLALKAILDGLYDYCKKNFGGFSESVPVFTLEKADEIVKVPSDRKAIIQKLVDGNHEQEFWDELERLNPDGATKLSFARIFTIRNDALKEFEIHIKNSDWTEPQWQKFFEKNTWIFGYGLSFKWVQSIGSKLEQTTEGSSIEGAGKRPDGFIKTLAEVATTAFVDIKKPDTLLLEDKEYRPEVYPVSHEVAGGVSQIQTTIQKWLNGEKHDLFRQKDEDGYTKNDPIFSYQPKGILVVGSLGQFKKNDLYHEAKISSFELFRRQVTNPEIITFDELYQRAKHIILNVQDK